MMSHIVFIALGFLLVGKGGDLFVDSSIHIAKVLHVPRVVIGATIVSLATTVPELTVSAMASVMGDSGIALGNAVGSAIANIGLIVGVVGMIILVQVDLHDFKRRFRWMFASAVLVIAFSWNLSMPRFFGSILLILSVIYLLYDYFKIREEKRKNTEKGIPDDLAGESMAKSVLFFLIGVVLVVLGSRFLVVSGSALAVSLGVPSAIIGLSIIAVGTSLPELVTGITAARKGVPDLAIGNIVGANVLNLAMITGISCIIRPLQLTRFTQLYSFPCLLIFLFAMFWMFRKKGELKRPHAIGLFMLYVLYLAGLVILPKI